MFLEADLSAWISNLEGLTFPHKYYYFENTNMYDVWRNNLFVVCLKQNVFLLPEYKKFSFILL